MPAWYNETIESQDVVDMAMLELDAMPTSEASRINLFEHNQQAPGVVGSSAAGHGQRWHSRYILVLERGAIWLVAERVNTPDACGEL